MINKDGIILSCESYKLTREEVAFFKNINPLGFVLFKRNFTTKKQVVALIESLKTSTLNSNLLIFIDQEGGRVQRFDNGEFIKFPPQRSFGDIYKRNKSKGLKLAYISSFLMGFQLKEVGIDVNFSPVCDLFFNNTHEVIGDRSFGDDPKLVRDLVNSFCRGFLDSGIIPVPKHFPGHGRSIFDTHFKSSTVKADYNELKKTDLVPFDILDKSLMVMIAHIIYSSIDSNVATYSNKINNDILRKKFNFKGLIISDDISMKAIKENLKTKVINCYNGGCDVVLYCKGSLREIKTIYPYVKILKKKQLNYFFEEKEKMIIKKKKYNKFKSELIEYGLIKNEPKS